MNLLRGAVRTYAWGSRTAIAEFTGRPSPTAHPEAELWFGAHPGDPAWLETDTGEHSLLQTVRDDPEGQLGAAVRSRFGDALPFLMKVLAADEPLSLQAHPSAEQAVEGFAREDRLGIPVSSPIRNYRDRSHKPELLVALQTVRGARRIPACAKDGRVDARAGGVRPRPVRRPAGRPARRRRAAGAVHHLDHRAAARSRCAGARGASTAQSTMSVRGRRNSRPKPRPCSNSASATPVTPACWPSLLLNRMSLGPARAIYLPAGNLHTYLHGVGHRGDGQLRQRAARWPDPETR